MGEDVKLHANLKIWIADIIYWEEFANRHINTYGTIV
jgi:hypothetical protein